MSLQQRLRQGRLQLTSSSLYEDLPVIQDGLIAHFPFDGKDKGYAYKNLMDYSSWANYVSGSTAPTNYSFNGLASENEIILDNDPSGKQTYIWRAINNDTTSNADGGWNYTIIYGIDSSSYYRYSLWVNAKVHGNGRCYHGLYGYNSSNSNVGVYNRSNGANNTNPYFHYPYCYNLPEDEWVLFVGHVHPEGSGTGANHTDSGVYNMKGQKISHGDGGTYDYVWRNDNTRARERVYLYYSTDTSTIIHWCYPRIDKCDGTEPSIDDLLKGEGNVTNVETNTNNTLTYNGIAVEESTTNLVAYPLEFENSWWSNSSYVENKLYQAPDGTITARRIKMGGASTAIYKTSIVTDGYSKSIWARTVYGTGTVSLCGYYGYSSKYLVELNENWQRFDFIADSSETGGTNFYVADFRGSATLDEVLVWGAQIEEKSFATSFANGNRSSEGLLQLPKELIRPTGSIHFKFTPHTFSDTTPRPIYSSGKDGGFDLLMQIAETSSSYWRQYNSPTSSVQYSTSTMFSTLNQEYDIVVTWENNGEANLYIDGTLKKNQTNCGNWYDYYVASGSGFYLGSGIRTGGSRSFTFKNLTIYDKVLSLNEVEKINQTKQINSSLETKEIIESEGWTHIYGGPHFYLSSDPDIHFKEIDYEKQADYSLQFNMMMIRARHVTSSESLPFIIGTFPEMCVFSQSYRWYTDYLDSLPDVNGTRLTMHSLEDGNLDITGSTSYLGYCYGNSWRLYANTYYTDGQSSYLGQYESKFNIELDHWGASYADNYTTLEEMLNDTLIESQSGFNLTPLKASMIDVYVKSGSDVDYELRLLEDSLKVKREVLEGVI